MDTIKLDTLWRPWQSGPSLHIIHLVVAQKAVLCLFLFLIPLLCPTFFLNETSIRNRFNSWDTEHYIFIATHGYEAGAGRCAFYPLWPSLIRIGAWLTGGDMLLVSYILANILSLAAIVLFHRLVWEQHGLNIAKRASLLLLLFPGSMFFFFPYSESLFLFLLMLFFYSLRQNTISYLAIASFLLPLTRAVGVFILPVLAWEVYRRRSSFRQYALCTMPLLGYASYFLLMYSTTSNPFEGFDAQKQFPAQASILRMFDLIGFADHFTGSQWSHNALYSFIDRGFFVLFLATMTWVIRMDSGYYLYCVLTGLIPALSNSLMSYTRFVSVVFPIFILWAIFTRKAHLYPLVLLVFFGMQLIFLLLHISGRWVG